MGKKQKCYITNFATFQANDNGTGKVRIVRDEAGNEIGFEVKGMLTVFDVRNENGGVFTSTSYDKFVDDYFIKNSLNVALCLLHDDSDIRNVCGYVKSMTKTDSGVEIVGFVPKAAYYYNLIKAYIEAGILQGFSNAGWVEDGEYDEETDTLKITEFALMHAALVVNPADTGAKLQTVNTIFKGFIQNEPIQHTEDPIDNEVNPDNSLDGWA
jgi:hypothetical protein